ncbi:MAG TPA: hypothetical protein PLZ51_25855, partial [Aggregatilineales bacterium]|nr:hypothetical protein [Aggregatilineales bacterium]
NIYPSGEDTAIIGFSGTWQFGLYAGDYDIYNIYNHLVAHVTIEEGVTTPIELPTGLLIVNDPNVKGYGIYPAGSDTAIFGWTGTWTHGIYAG